VTNKPESALLYIKLQNGSATYNSDYSVTFTGGPIWPRELELAHKLICEYKRHDKEYNRDAKRVTT